MSATTSDPESHGQMDATQKTETAPSVESVPSVEVPESDAKHPKAEPAATASLTRLVTAPVVLCQPTRAMDSVDLEQLGKGDWAMSPPSNDERGMSVHLLADLAGVRARLKLHKSDVPSVHYDVACQCLGERQLLVHVNLTKKQTLPLVVQQNIKLVNCAGPVQLIAGPGCVVKAKKGTKTSSVVSSTFKYPAEMLLVTSENPHITQLNIKADSDSDTEKEGVQVLVLGNTHIVLDAAALSVTHHATASLNYY